MHRGPHVCKTPTWSEPCVPFTEENTEALGIQQPIWAGDETAYGCPQATAQCPCGKCHVRDPGTLGYEIKISPTCLAADLQAWGPVGSGPGSGQPLPNTVLSSSRGRGAHLRKIGLWGGWPSCEHSHAPSGHRPVRTHCHPSHEPLL